MEIKLRLKYHEKQKEILFGQKKKYKIIAKGRRFGLTKGLCNYLIENLLINNGPILWVDTTYGNIVRYYERYIEPEIREIKKIVKFDRQRYMLRFNKTYCDFRSAEREQNIEGFAYRIIILNEAGIILKKRQLWEQSIKPMMLDYSADILIGGTPKGKYHNNKTHLFYELFEKGKINKNWESFQYSTYDNPIIDPEDIKELELDYASNPELARQEIYGEFIETGELGIIKKEWIQFCDPDEWRTQKIFGLFSSWDTAFKKNEENDYSVCTTWVITDQFYYLIDFYKERDEFPDLKRKVVEIQDKYKTKGILIEDKASGQSLIQELQRNTRLPIIAIKPERDKIARLNAVSTLFEAGKVKISDNIWKKEELLLELLEFPQGEFDDAVDSVSQLLNYIKDKQSQFENVIKHVRRKAR